MKAIGLTEFAGPDVLHVVDLPTPEPGPGEIRIRVHGVAVNPTDATFRAGRRASQLADRTPPYVPGVDVAGVVDELGRETDGRLAVGDRVIALVVPMGPRGGTYAEQVVVDQRAVIHAPKDTAHSEASTLLLNAPTAHLALDALHLDAGQTLAVTGAAGAVGGCAIQLAKARGLTVIADAAADDDDLVRTLGTALLDELRALAEDGTLSLRVADVMPARDAAQAHQRLAAGGIRGRLVLDFETPLA
jgi:NADPH:quinone reductase-like Zn-dependent oxidoreductase